MKTFLPVISPGLNPWQSMRLSLECLDNQRLGKQRVESYQIYNVITGISGAKGWRSAPAVQMWRGYPQALGVYIKINCELWAKRLSKSGQPFSNAKMEEHIQRLGFGKNDAGVDVAALAMQASADDSDAAAPAATADIPAASPNSSAMDAAAAVAIPAAAAAAAAPRSGTYVDGIRVPWWMHDARVHDSDAAILHTKNPQFYKDFAHHAKKYPEYIWPRDIDPYHPEQKEELDALAAIVAEETAVKEAAKEAKKLEREAKKQRARASKAKKGVTADEKENEEEPDDVESPDEAESGVDSADEGTEAGAAMMDEHAVTATPVKRATRRSRTAAPSAPNKSIASPASTVAAASETAASPAAPSAKRRRTSRTALKDSTDEVLNSTDKQPADDAGDAVSSTKRGRSATSKTRSKLQEEKEVVGAKRKLRL